MRYLALACSYDRTIASGGRIDTTTLAGLRRLVASGRQLVLLSRRPLEDLLGSLPDKLFAWIVAEHGGVLYDPGTQVAGRLADPLPDPLLRALRDRRVEPLLPGQVSVSSAGANEAALRQAIEAVGVDFSVIVDKDLTVAVPAGVDKASGLAAALEQLELSPHNVVGVGDAATDLAFLQRCEFAVAVANAPRALAERCDLVTDRPAGEGVVELVDRLVADDLAGVEPRRGRRRLLLGHADGGEVAVPVYASNLLLAGSSGTGKSTLVAGLLERLGAQRYQFLVLDPEGDHADLAGAAHLGGRHDAPTVEAVIGALRQDPERPVVANLLALRLATLPAFLSGLLGPLGELRTRTGRPHLLVLDEAHHFLPLPGERDAVILPRWVDGLVMATVNPEHVSPTALSLADVVVTFGDAAGSALERYCQAIGEPQPPSAPAEVPPGHALAFHRSAGDGLIGFAGDGLVGFRIAGGQTQRRPHLRRYAESELDEDKSFYFRGPDGRLRLRAATLAWFIRLAEGVDDATWLFHLERGEYSAWFRDGIGDEPLSEAAERVEQAANAMPAQQSREQIIAAIRQRYLERDQ